MNESRTALIVGAGIGGLAAAIALKRVGWNVRIYERASQVRELGSQALEDAVALGLAISGSDAIDARLRRYEIVRARRTERFIKLGPRIARITTTRSGLKQAVRSFALRVLPERAIRQMVASLERDPHRALRARREASAFTKGVGCD